jgi:hypothetical protein
MNGSALTAFCPFDKEWPDGNANGKCCTFAYFRIERNCSSMALDHPVEYA